MNRAPLLAAVEGGGTKFVCAVGYSHNERLAERRLATTTPQATLAAVVDFLRPYPIAALGVATFGPLQLAPGPTQGQLLATPKAGWSHTPVLKVLTEALEVSGCIDTDVNAAAWAEAHWGQAQGCDPVLYVTVGTGIGGGVCIGGQPLHGSLHPEFGHMRLPRQLGLDGQIDTMPSVCPFHEDCLEGLASGTALWRRLGADPHTADPRDPRLSLTARYLALGLLNATMVLAPERIILGGGVLHIPGLRDQVRTQLMQLAAGYPNCPALHNAVDRYVVAPAFADAGLVGAFALAAQALCRNT